MDEKVHNLLKLIKEAEHDVLYVELESQRETLNYLQIEKALIYELNTTIKRYLELKKDFMESSGRLFENSANKKSKKNVLRNIENMGLKVEKLEKRLDQTRYEYSYSIEYVSDHKHKIKELEMDLENMDKN